MKILISSHFFSPSIGGIERVSGILAAEWAALGHEVTVITTTPAGMALEEQQFRVMRQPTRMAVLKAISACDLYFQSNISLQTLWPILFIKRPVVVTHHTWISRGEGRLNWNDRLKLLVTRFASINLAVSRALARSIPASCRVIENPYNDDIFDRIPSIPKSRDLIFVGRFVSDKGADLCLEALAKLKEDGLTPSLTMVGSGPEEGALREQCSRLKLGGQVEFAGVHSGRDLSELLNAHRIIVIPSRWNEPFGLVALEGIACGCVAVGSAGGGLSDAIGPCGVTFENGSAAALADRLQELLRNAEGLELFQERAQEHLAKHGRRRVAESYLEIFKKLTDRFNDEN